MRRPLRGGVPHKGTTQTAHLASCSSAATANENKWRNVALTSEDVSRGKRPRRMNTGYKRTLLKRIVECSMSFKNNEVDDCTFLVKHLNVVFQVRTQKWLLLFALFHLLRRLMICSQVTGCFFIYKHSPTRTFLIWKKKKKKKISVGWNDSSTSPQGRPNMYRLHWRSTQQHSVWHKLCHMNHLSGINVAFIWLFSNG